VLFRGVALRLGRRAVETSLQKKVETARGVALRLGRRAVETDALD